MRLRRHALRPDPMQIYGQRINEAIDAMEAGNACPDQTEKLIRYGHARSLCIQALRRWEEKAVEDRVPEQIEELDRAISNLIQTSILPQTRAQFNSAMETKGPFARRSKLKILLSLLDEVLKVEPAEELRILRKKISERLSLQGEERRLT